MGRILTLSVSLAAASCASAPSSVSAPGKILVVVAHPDDETLFGPALARLAREGAAIRIVYVADGRHGVRDHAGIPAGEALIAVRQDEARCAATAHGLGEPVFLGFSDQFVGGGHIRDQFAVLRAARTAIAAEIDRFGPDIVLTFSPGGDTGHPDHRLVGDMTTEIMLAREGDDVRLFQAGWTKSANALYDQAGIGFAVHRDDAFDVAFGHTQEDEAAAAEALRCYASQFTPEEIEGFIALEKADQSDRRWFREATMKREARAHF